MVHVVLISVIPGVMIGADILEHDGPTGLTLCQDEQEDASALTSISSHKVPRYENRTACGMAVRLVIVSAE